MRTLIAVLLLLALLALPAHGASLRMEALGTDLIGIIDDPGTDMTEYPEGNTFRTDWLTGLELPESDFYGLRVLKPGPFSIGADVFGYLGMYAGFPHLTVPVSFRAAGLGWGAAIGFPRWFPAAIDTADPVGATAYFPRLEDHATLGACWLGRGLRLDARLAVSVEQSETWVDTGAGARRSTSDVLASQEPSLRLAANFGDLTLSTGASYLRQGDYLTDAVSGARIDHPDVINRLTPYVGFAYSRRKGLTLAAALKPQVTLETFGGSDWSWGLSVPVGIEWTTGILTARLGAELATPFPNSFTEAPSFSRYLTAGFAVKPVPRLTLDFNPSVDDLSNLYEWQLGASYTF